MAKSNVLSLNGFDDLLDKIARAGDRADEAAVKAVTAGAKAYDAELRKQCAAAGVADHITNGITTEIENKGSRARVAVGWKLGEYDPNHLTDGYKALFLNYGTPHRSKHGKVAARGFIGRAKTKSKKAVKAAQQEALDEIVKELNG